MDDGCRSDLRVAELADKYELEAVFYLPVNWQLHALDNGFEPLEYGEALDIAQRYEIGSHTITHRHLTKLPLAEAVHEIVDSKFMLQQLFPDNKISKFCPPRGYTNADLSQRTLLNYESQRLTRGQGLVHVHPKSGANNDMPWREYAKTIDVKEAWCHSWELDKYDLWDELEGFLRENS